MKLNFNLQKNRILIFNIIFLILSSCGSLTKMRYSKGFKSNIEFYIGRKDEQAESHIALKAIKKQSVKTFPNRMQAVHAEITSELNPYNHAVNKAGNTIPEIKSATVYAPIYSAQEQIRPLFSQKNSKSTSDQPVKTMEPTTMVGGILFFVGIASLIGAGVLELLMLSNIALLLAVIGMLLFFAGIILCIIGLVRISRSNKKYRGIGLDISVIMLGVFLTILLLL